MKQKVVVIWILVILIIILSITSIMIYFNVKENKRIDAEAVTLYENRTIEFGKKAKVSDFIENINGKLIDDYEIDTENLGDKEIDFEFLNIKNKKRKGTYWVKIIDTTAPKILCGNSYTVKRRI